MAIRKAARDHFEFPGFLLEPSGGRVEQYFMRLVDPESSSYSSFRFWIADNVPGSAQRASAQKLPIACSRNPFCAREVAVECSAGAIAFRLRIDMQSNFRHLAPVGPHGLRVEHPNVSDGMLLIVRSQFVAIGREIGDVCPRSHGGHFTRQWLRN
jgi:hypothetical protein